MSYRCAIGPGIPGLEPGPAYIRCDLCLTRLVITFRSGPPAWLMSGKAPRGWKCKPHPDGKRFDYCPACKPGADPWVAFLGLCRRIAQDLHSDAMIFLATGESPRGHAWNLRAAARAMFEHAGAVPDGGWNSPR